MTDAAFDYIVVGAGSAGCALASRLSEQARVLLLERGGPDSQPHIHDPAGIFQAVFVDKTITPDEYISDAEPGLGNRSIPIQRGIVRGGCSSINGMVYIRGNPRDYDHWAELGNIGWSYDDVLPYFKRSERYAEGASTYHGTDGPLHVRRVPNPSTVASAFIESVAALAAFRDSDSDFDFNGPRQQGGAGFYRVTVTPEGRRASAAVAFLDPAKNRSTLEVRSNARVRNIVIEHGRAVGVRCRIEGEVQVFNAGEIILSAGAFESPRLLQLSGIGPAADLKTLGIEPVVDLPGVGQNLHDHTMMLTYWPASRPTPASTFIAEAGLFVHSNDRSSDSPPDLQYHFLAGMVGLAADPRTEPNFLFCPAVCAPHSRGAIRLRSADPEDRLNIRPNYLACEADVQVLLRGIELAFELAGTTPLSGFRSSQPPFVAVVRDGAPVRAPLPRNDEAELRRLVAEAAQTVWHPVGTCKMGPDSDPTAVVDPALHVYGVEGLRVADASIMPVIPRGNTNAPCIMIGERAADLIRGTSSPPSLAR
jgi:choline dehydrogenase